MITRSLMRRALLGTGVLVLPAATALAGDLQDEMAARWRGAWVITSAETYSDCGGLYTDNRVNGKLVSSRSRQRFRPGELAKVDGIDLKRSRFDLRLTFAEPILASRQEGPFTLFNEARCQVEFQVELPRDMVKNGDVMAIDRLLLPVLQRHATEETARNSSAWNERERDPYPADYERTLRAHAAWKARQTNAAVQARINHLVDETSRIPERINADPDYMAGFVKGVEAGRAQQQVNCPDLLRAEPATYKPGAGTSAGAAHAANSARQNRQAQGYNDGVRLAFGLDAVRRLPACFVPVPSEEESTTASR